MIKETTFTIYLNIDYFRKEDIIIHQNLRVKMVSNPKRKWYKYLFELITIGFYKAPFEYKVERV